MTDRNNGIGHLAARSLIEEIALLRDAIDQQGVMLQSMDIAMTAIYRELHEGLLQQQGFRPRYLRAED